MAKISFSEFRWEIHERGNLCGDGKISLGWELQSGKRIMGIKIMDEKKKNQIFLRPKTLPIWKTFGVLLKVFARKARCPLQ